MKVKISDIEFYLPHKSETGDQLKLDNPDWDIEKIEGKTGIKKRFISDVDETALDLAIVATERLFKKGVKIDEIDFLIYVTQSPDYLLPTSACILQDKLGLRKNCIAFDVNLGCSGFVYGLSIGGALIESKLCSQGIIVCADTYTKYIDKNDRTCRPIFSDGASSTLISLSENDQIGSFDLGTDGSGANNLIVYNSANRISKDKEKNLFMAGSDIFIFTMSSVPNCLNKILMEAKLKLKDIDLFIFHQASKLVIDTIVNRLKIDPKKCFNNYHEIGNTVSSSIPIALSQANSSGKLNSGDKVLLLGFGVGYSWGGCVVHWS